MFRSALDVLAKLEAQGVSLHMIDLGGDVTGNGISKLMFTILSAVAEAERDRIRERVATVKADQKARQRYLGGKIPFGFRRRRWHPATGSGAASGNFHGAANAGERCQAPRYSRDPARAVRGAVVDGWTARHVG